MNKEQTVFEQLSNLSNFKKWSSTALKAFNNYIIIMTNNSDKILSAVFLSLLLISEIIQ